MIKHTAGPWLIGENRYDYDLIIRSANNDPVCSVIYAGYSKTEARANARLIAAAPDLVEALKEMCSYTAELNPNQGFDGLDHFAVNKAQAAIAKTEEQA